MVTLPTKEEHDEAIDALMNYRDKEDILGRAEQYLMAGDKINFDKMLRLSRSISDTVRAMQKGYDYFRVHRQIDPASLALRAISETDPVFNGKRKSACDSCEYKNNCPFSAVSKRILDHVCPLRRKDYCSMLFKAYKGESTETPLTQSEMAELALTHLS